MPARITVTFMDNSESHFRMGDGSDPFDYYSWTPNPNMGLVLSRHTKGERTVIPWHNIKFYDVIIPDAPLRDTEPTQIKYGDDFLQLPNKRCKAGIIVHTEHGRTEKVRCHKPTGHDMVELKNMSRLLHQHSAVTEDGKHSLHWYNGEVPANVKVNELHTERPGSKWTS
jgi:hypothetical protein